MIILRLFSFFVISGIPWEELFNQQYLLGLNSSLWFSPVYIAAIAMETTSFVFNNKK